MSAHGSLRRQSIKKSKRRGSKNRVLRDRILLYLSGLGVDGLTSLELAAECFRRCSSDPTQEEVMRILTALLREKGTTYQAIGFLPLLHSYPPLNRRPMVSERMGYSPTVKSIIGLIQRFLGLGKARAKQ